MTHNYKHLIFNEAGPHVLITSSGRYYPAFRSWLLSSFVEIDMPGLELVNVEFYLFTCNSKIQTADRSNTSSLRLVSILSIISIIDIWFPLYSLSVKPLPQKKKRMTNE